MKERIFGLLILAQEATVHKTWWNPTVKGILVVIAAVMLFVGSAYLLLYTDVGSRLGFLIVAGTFTGFIALISTLWIFAQTPQGLLGRLPRWDVKEIVPTLSASKYPAVQQMTSKNVAPSTLASQIKPDLDTQVANPSGNSKFNLYAKPEAYFAVQSFAVGGGRKFLWFWSDKTQYGATEICDAISPNVPFGDVPPAPQCAPGAKHQFVISIHNLGAQRQPAFLFLGGSAGLFALVMLSLRRYERDEEQRLAQTSGGPGGNGSGSGSGSGPGGDGSGDGEAAVASVGTGSSEVEEAT